MCQSLTHLREGFQCLFWSVHVLPVSGHFDGVDLASLFPFPYLFWGDGDVEVFVHERDEFFQRHGVAGLLMCVVLLVFGPFGVAVDFGLGEVAAGFYFPVQLGRVGVCGHVW